MVVIFPKTVSLIPPTIQYGRTYRISMKLGTFKPNYVEQTPMIVFFKWQINFSSFCTETCFFNYTAINHCTPAYNSHFIQYSLFYDDVN